MRTLIKFTIFDIWSAHSRVVDGSACSKLSKTDSHLPGSIPTTRENVQWISQAKKQKKETNPGQYGMKKLKDLTTASVVNFEPESHFVVFLGCPSCVTTMLLQLCLKWRNGYFMLKRKLYIVTQGPWVSAPSSYDNMTGWQSPQMVSYSWYRKFRCSLCCFANSCILFRTILKFLSPEILS